MFQGHLSKMTVWLEDGMAHYALNLRAQEPVTLNHRLGQTITIQFESLIHCLSCGRKTNKSFSQGYCYPCFQTLAACDLCIMKPETCHHHLGTCREPQWGTDHCMVGHTVYLANTSGLKVGITRNTQVPIRWIDQGAVQALPICQVKTRRISGLVEVAIGKWVSDKTHWQRLLKGNPERIDLLEKRDELWEAIAAERAEIQAEFGEDAIQPITDMQPIDIEYPVTEFPTKVKSLNLDKTPVVSGKLLGIKGQYLILDTGVINLRKFTSYLVRVSFD